jgi:hypothetical protein
VYSNHHFEYFEPAILRLKPERDYLPRIVDTLLKERLHAIGAVLVAGPKWCGKTTTAEQQAKSVLKLQDPDKTKAYLAVSPFSEISRKEETDYGVCHYRHPPITYTDLLFIGNRLSA